MEKSQLKKYSTLNNLLYFILNIIIFIFICKVVYVIYILKYPI